MILLGLLRFPIILLLGIIFMTNISKFFYIFYKIVICKINNHFFSLKNKRFFITNGIAI